MIAKTLAGLAFCFLALTFATRANASYCQELLSALDRNCLENKIACGSAPSCETAFQACDAEAEVMYRQCLLNPCGGPQEPPCPSSTHTWRFTDGVKSADLHSIRFPRGTDALESIGK
jgi:hypothetical protein